jgi:two-component system, cell cycle sensor histidine kinase and response regulator CckA
MQDSFLPPEGIPLAARPRVFRLLLLLFLLLASSLWFSSRALLVSNFLPHWYCLAGNTRLLWTTVLGDMFIGLSYVVISATLLRIVRRSGRDLPYQGFFWAFGLFIISCGITHFLEVVTVWHPIYWIAAAAKILTAVSSAGTALVLLLAAEDIIELVRTARQLSAKRGDARFRALFMATPLAVLSFDLAGLVTSWNPGAEKIFGYTEGEVVGKTNPLVPPELLAEHQELLKSTLSGNVTKGYETVRKHRDGSRIPVNVYSAPLMDNGRQVGLMAAIEDISERKQMEEELEQKQIALEAHLRQSQNMDLLARVAGGIAHDFNNMLMILSGSSELLDRSLGTDSLSRVYVDQIQRTTTKAASITRQLLAFSRKQVLDIRPMDLHVALADSQSMLARLLGPEIEIESHPDARNFWIRSDPPQVVQVLVNLSSNARDAMPGGGRLSIVTRNADALPRAVKPDAENIAEWVVLEVGDTGAGMDQETLAQIFVPFFTTKPIGTATGLGLSTVYGIVRQSGGHIQVQSEVGRGTSFAIYFPAIPEPQVVLTAQPLVSGAQAATVTVLLVDDEAALVHAIGEFLRESGFIVLDAFSSQDALEIAKDHPGAIDILVTDVVMPGMRGPDLHRRVLELQPNLQVLFMSGYAEGLPETKLPQGALFLQKPFRFSALLERLRQFQ